MSSLAVWLLTGSAQVAWVIGSRLAMFVCAIFVGLILCVYINRSRRSIAGCFEPGALGGVLGLAAGLCVAGAAVEDPLTLDKKTATLVKVGQALDFEATTLAGEPYRLQDQRGRVVLVDFWATWCDPCLRELPHVEELYQRYHERGFDMVGVSLDSGDQPLLSFLQDHPLPWPQIVDSDRTDRLTDLYGVDAIPYTILVGRDGLVHETALYGEQLEAAIQEVLAVPENSRGLIRPVAGRRMRQWLLRFFLAFVNALLLSPWWWLMGGILVCCCLGGVLEWGVGQALGWTISKITGNRPANGAGARCQSCDAEL